ncbi:MAG: NAD-dependent epimerase/dehydratase family protein [Pseudomonadota bacterium]
MEKTIQPVKRILITGASGYIGKALAGRLSGQHEVMGLYHRNPPADLGSIIWEKADLSNADTIERLMRQFSPDVVIHSAAIAHQSLQPINRKTYFEVNSTATEKIARAACLANPDVRFIFMSSISVYGENRLVIPVAETHPCRPSGDYAMSKLDAENRLLELCHKGQLRFLTIFRLAPVYDKTWSHNLDRRVWGPLKLFYLKFGSGHQRMSALARANLSDLIEYWIADEKWKTESPMILNVCDEKPYSFHEMIRIFRKSGIRPSVPVISCPLFFIYGATRITGLFFPGKKEWIHACYEKLAFSLVFDNKKMLETGFTPAHDLAGVFGVTGR